MKILLVTMIVLGISFFALNAEAFCVYNRADIKIHIYQIGGGTTIMSKRFSADLNPGEKACCNWQNSDCNKEGKRDSTLVFNVEKGGNKNLCTITIPAGGWLEIKGEKGVYKCEGHSY